MITKFESKFWFSNDYLDHSAKWQKATVILEVNYKTKTFSIIPFCGTHDFQFRESSYKSMMWKAIIKSIDEAIDFANNELDTLENTALK
jgi:hypothetical protein